MIIFTESNESLLVGKFTIWILDISFHELQVQGIF